MGDNGLEPAAPSASSSVAYKGRYGFTPPSLNLVGDSDYLSQCTVQYSPIDCVDASPLTVAVACEDPQLRAKYQMACTMLNMMYPDVPLRARLFDNNGIGMPSSMTPFTIVNQLGSYGLQHLVKSHGVFFDLAASIQRLNPAILSDRNLSVLYPGSGAHVSPVLTAMGLIDSNAIDTAEFVYTELNPETAKNIYSGLMEIGRLKPGLLESVALNGDTITIVYKGKPITIRVDVNTEAEAGLSPGESRSGEIFQYMTEEQFKKADLVILHDLYADPDHAILDLLEAQRKIGSGDRLVLATVSSLPAKNRYLPILGPYGCGLDSEIGAPQEPYYPSLMDLGK